jgi:chromosome segregation ATPase
MEQHDFKCNYLEDKPNRDRVRETVWRKIETFDDVIKKTYETLEAFQREIRSSDGVQDRHIEELKAMVQEMAASQHGTDEEMQQLKLQIGTLRSEIGELRHELGNGFTEKLGNDITDRLFKLIEIMNQNNHAIRTTETTTESKVKISDVELKKLKMQKRFEFWTRLLTTGGILFFLVSELLRYFLR